MANSQRPLVNQRLYFVRLHSDWLEAQRAAEQLPRAVVDQALGESLILHLVLAYQAYLNEVAEAYQLPASNNIRAVALVEQLAARGQSSAEAEELRSLELSDSWLSQVLKHFENLGQGELSLAASPQASSNSVNKQAVELIGSSNNQSQAIDITALNTAAQSLEALIERQRTCTEEW